MALPNEHGRLIAAAAKAALGPLGCKRHGQSRTWVSDEKLWAIVIEFQPSSWSKGTYLNVGACWLWRADRDLSFDAGYRVADFIPFESTEQFAPLVAAMATQAAREVIALRTRFQSINDIHRHLAKAVNRTACPCTLQR
jgi:hypothetical protein